MVSVAVTVVSDGCAGLGRGRVRLDGTRRRRADEQADAHEDGSDDDPARRSNDMASTVPADRRTRDIGARTAPTSVGQRIALRTIEPR